MIARVSFAATVAALILLSIVTPSALAKKSIFSEGITIQVISDPWVIYQFEDQSIGLYLQEGGHNLNKLTPIQTETDFKDFKEALTFIRLEVK